MSTFEGRVAIVTGAGKGLGRVYAEYLAARGARVLVNNRRHPGEAPGGTSAERAVAAIGALGGQALASFENVEDPRSGARMVEQALGAWGRLDILVNNAGVEEGEAFHKTSLESLRHVFEINFFGTLHAVHAAYPVMRQARFGRIVISTSTAGLYGNHGMSGYSSSKAALIGLMRTLALEGAARNVRANAIAPFAATPMTDRYLSEEQRQALGADRVAPVLAWLASEECSLNGEILISGRGVLRRAAMSESRGAVLPDGALSSDVAANWQAAADFTAAREFPSGNDAFADLMRR
jgi:NAD(P)-dependent dehydrogenase (short-subunit alcohol dehydrogenase family)